MIRCQPTVTLLEVWGEAIRWEREGMSGGARGQSKSVNLVSKIQFELQGGPGLGSRVRLHESVTGPSATSFCCSLVR